MKAYNIALKSVCCWQMFKREKNKDYFVITALHILVCTLSVKVVRIILQKST